jgi:RNA polymerase sigma-70 factor, ECF subfamily
MNLFRRRRYSYASAVNSGDAPHGVGDRRRMVIVSHALLAEDSNVVARMAQGDRQALAELHARYGRSLFGYLCVLTDDPELAEELLQDTLLAAWTGAGGYAGQASVFGWLLGIARRRAHDARRRRALQVVDLAQCAFLPTTEPDPEDAVVAQAAQDDVAAAIARLPPLAREVLELTFGAALSQQDLAAVLGIPVGTVKSRLHHAKRALRAALRPAEVSR